MKNGNCTECDKPLFDQNPDGESQLCDTCFEELVEEEPHDAMVNNDMDDDSDDRPVEFVKNEE